MKAGRPLTSKSSKSSGYREYCITMWHNGLARNEVPNIRLKGGHTLNDEIQPSVMR